MLLLINKIEKIINYRSSQITCFVIDDRIKLIRFSAINKQDFNEKCGHLRIIRKNVICFKIFSYMYLYMCIYYYSVNVFLCRLISSNDLDL